MRYLNKSEIQVVAEMVLRAYEIHPLSHFEMCEHASECFREEYGFVPAKSCILLAVKLAKHGWQNLIMSTKAEIARNEEAEMNKETTHYLHYNFCEDEADMTGMAFVSNAGGKTVDMYTTYSGYPEWEKESRKTLPVEEARAIWKELVAERDHGGDHIFENRTESSS
jgi:hypothetical protein